MNYDQKKAIKIWIKNFDQKYLSGSIKKMIQGREEPAWDPAITDEEKEAIRQEIIHQVQRPLPNNGDIKRVEIIVLKYKDPEVEIKCAQNIIENTEWPYKLNFFDNRPGTKNMGKTWNKLIRESTCDYVALMDSDAFVPKLEPCWLTRCMETFEQYPDCYVVSPMLDRIGMAQQCASVAKNRPPEKMIDKFANTCAVFKKEVFEKIGYYDEDFLIYGSDSEWAWRFIRSKEYVGYLRPDIIVHHEHHHSVKKAVAKQEYDSIAEKEYAINLYKQKTNNKSL